MTQQARDNYQRLRVRMLESGFSVRSWAEARGFVPSTVYDSLKGKRHGVEARKIRRAAERAFDV